MQTEYREVLLPFTQFSYTHTLAPVVVFYIIKAQYQPGRMCVYSSVSREHYHLWIEGLATYFTQCNIFLHDYKAETKLSNRLALVFGRQSLWSLCCGKTNLGSHVRRRKSRDAHVNKATCDNWLCDFSQDIIPSRICLFDLHTGDPG